MSLVARYHTASIAQQKREDDLIYEMMLGEDLTPLIQGGLLNTQPVVAAAPPAPYVAPVVRSNGGNGGNGAPKGNNSWQGTNSSGTAKKGFSFGL